VPSLCNKILLIPISSIRVRFSVCGVESNSICMFLCWSAVGSLLWCWVQLVYVNFYLLCLFLWVLILLFLTWLPHVQLF